MVEDLEVEAEGERQRGAGSLLKEWGPSILRTIPQRLGQGPHKLKCGTQWPTATPMGQLPGGIPWKTGQLRTGVRMSVFQRPKCSPPPVHHLLRTTLHLGKVWILHLCCKSLWLEEENHLPPLPLKVWSSPTPTTTSQRSSHSSHLPAAAPPVAQATHTLLCRRFWELVLGTWAKPRGPSPVLELRYWNS